MPRHKKPGLQLHVVNSTAILAALTRGAHDRRSRAKRNYLLCKAALIRRRREIEERKVRGGEIADLQRMVERLEASLQAHKRIIENDG